ncbi:MAG: MBL fold metallo-hydrolase [Syntrophomonas sp.]|nr:MBL fold metallo-hydrolase [Syntrophomonas sp.]
MITEILPDIFKIDVPLPHNPLKSTNSYFIRNSERNLLIDTGFNCEASKNVMDKALKFLGAQMENTDLFITHLHSDHSGLIEYLATPATTVWMSQSDIMKETKQNSEEKRNAAIKLKSASPGSIPGLAQTSGYPALSDLVESSVHE